ncbi:MAG TPA: gluconate 2-dehydrogenase subunit 3 family protein [Anaeromyxobacteraceae bacterium]|nr:gluconate 2-dehydrogenase subunit 3 family protein [Anaeromyxobacteraceae bacterium]
MFGRSRRHRERLLLPGETLGRRRFILGGLTGMALIAAAGWLALRRRDDLDGVGGPFAVLAPGEAAILLAAARRILPSASPFPTAERVRVAERVDAFLAMSHPGVQKDAKRLLTLFDSALVGLLLDGSPTCFRWTSPSRQDARLAAWSTSRIDLRRTGFRALRRLITSAYYSSPATWGAVGYRGPPSLGAAPGGKGGEHG